MAYTIIKYVTALIDGVEHTLPVLMLDTNDEVWEFDTKEEAEHIASILEQNSTTGKKYKVV